MIKIFSLLVWGFFMDKILFFDGECVMCNGLVGFVLRHDKKHVFKFAPLQGETAKKYIPQFTNLNLKTVVLMDENGVHTESTAIIKLFLGLGKIFKLAIIFKIIPKIIRDKIYRYIAHNRYRWFGKTKNCAFLTKEEKKYILD
jgi:predicted DCC family thiol-disulfide oxidoreductase YuxK